MKTCIKCHIVKLASEFTRARQACDGLSSWCKACCNSVRIARRRANGVKPRPKIHTSAQQRCIVCKLWKNYDQFALERARPNGYAPRCLICNRQHRSKYYTKQKSTAYAHKRRRLNLSVRILDSLRSRVYVALRKLKKSRATLALVGCTVDQLKLYLQSKWSPGMSWANYGRTGWHMDHIIPCCAFDLTDPKQQVKCFHYTNLQPLWAADNLHKSSKVDYISSN